MTLIEAATRLAETTNNPDDTYDDAMDAAQEVLRAADEATQSELDGALRVLLAAVRAADDDRAGIGAIVAGAVIERGADAALGCEHIVERFVYVVGRCATYVAKCREYFEEHILSDDAVCEVCGPDDDEEDILMPQVREAVSLEYPEGEPAWVSLDLFCRPSVSALLRVPEARRHLARDMEFVNTIGALSFHQPGAYFVWALLSLLEDETLIVLDPEAKKGFEVVMNGVADNAQLHLLLVDALIGGGHLPGEPLDPEVTEVVRGTGPQVLNDYAMGEWNLYNWTALRPDGTVPDGYFDQGAQHLIRNDEVPANIHPLDGQRIVLLGPSPVIRQWQPARLFGPLEAKLEVSRELSEGEVATWLQKLTNTLAAHSQAG